VKIQVEVFWVVMLCSVEVGYQHFAGPCCLHLQGDVNVGILSQHYIVSQSRRSQPEGIKLFKQFPVLMKLKCASQSPQKLLIEPCFELCLKFDSLQAAFPFQFM